MIRIRLYDPYYPGAFRCSDKSAYQGSELHPCYVPYARNDHIAGYLMRDPDGYIPYGKGQHDEYCLIAVDRPDEPRRGSGIDLGIFVESKFGLAENAVEKFDGPGDIILAVAVPEREHGEECTRKGNDRCRDDKRSF